VIGIDLGTTNSAIALWRDGKAQLIPNSLGDVLTPSAVALDDDGQFLIGMAARERQVTHPRFAATAFKRYMGTRRSIPIGARHFLPEELSAMVLSRLRADAEAFLGSPVDTAVITVPAYFNDKQRKATRRAGELAGLRVERLINEPTAAALAYGIERRKDETRFLIFDLGGGTFDVSVLELFEGVIEVRASTGDNFLGGEDFNEVLIADMVKAHASAWKDSLEDPVLRERLRFEAERARRWLSNHASATMTVNWNGQAFEHTVTSQTFESLCQQLLTRLRDPVIRALRDSNIPVESLSEIVLIGGATRMSVVRQTVTRMFGRFPSTEVNPDEAVALGAAVQAGLKARDAALREVVLTDVCPYSLGVNIAEHRPDGKLQSDVFAPIIERNTLIPASRVKRFTTVQDGQQKVTFHIYQGESRKASDNIDLGVVEIPVPQAPAGTIPVDTRFTYDVNGLLEVDVHVPNTDERRQLVIFDADDAMAGADVENRREALAALKVHPRDLDANRAAMARAERCYELLLGDKREFVSQLISDFQAALDTQDPSVANHARVRLVAALDSLDGGRFL